MTMPVELPLLAFENAAAFEKWLTKNHERQDGIWVKLFKKNSGVSSVSYAEAVEIALCFGWIDSLLKRLDDKAYLQKFSPRRPKSKWSKINIGHIERLTKAGRMQPAGLEEVVKAKADGRWEAAYDSPSTMTLPAEFTDLLAKNTKAADFFKTLNKANIYAIGWRLQTAKKPETKQKRITELIAMLAREEKLH